MDRQTIADICQLPFNSLNPELNPICYLLALLAHDFLHVNRIRVKSLTLRLLMSYIYVYVCDISSLTGKWRKLSAYVEAFKMCFNGLFYYPVLITVLKHC
jgi:hypothetical protein